MMSRHVHATIPAADLARAKTWYKDKLGLTPTREETVGYIYDLEGGSGFMLYQTPNAGQAPNTLMTFESTNLRNDMAEMRQRGVRFEEYDMPGLKTVNAVAEMDGFHSAWFKDSEGNILAIGDGMH
jgi:catechol 2,3-dioxygenase-like lactoylglutathione lyase family enzyme